MSGMRVAGAGRHLFVATILTGSFLLFLVQPMIARIVLPRLGGAPAVWNSAMLVYQALLLAGYGYAHAIGRFAPRRQAAVHIGVFLVAALWLPIGVLAWQLPEGTQPAVWVPLLLAASIGPLFLAVAAQAPLIQRWFAIASDGEDPYRLYAASNLGSFAGLIAYPLLVEPGMTVQGQRWLWSAGYVVLLLLVLACARRLPAGEPAARPAALSTDAPRPGRVAHWIVLSFVPSGLMLATSTYLTTDIVAMPLLWVLPLGLYLLSFSVAFAANRAPAELVARLAPVTILLFGGVIIGGAQQNAAIGATVALTLLFMASAALHTALYQLRPAPERLTGFYLAMSAGGALGGVFAALVAPVLFDWTWEYPLLILAAGVLVPQAYLLRATRRLWERNRLAIMATIVFALALLLVLRVWGPADLFGEGHMGFAFTVLTGVGLVAIGARRAYLAVLVVALLLFGGFDAIAISLKGDVRTRSYFGVYTITESPDRRTLAHGTTMHGLQLLGSPERVRTPTSYYSLSSGVGQAMTLAPSLYGANARIAVVGLGTGTLACYAQPGQRWRFYEIDPTVVHLARRRFSYLSICAPQAGIVVGDARLSLDRAGPASLDMIALDAFSSDSVPMHLLTREAFAGYARVLDARGLLLVHISNRFLDLSPVVAAAARDGGWQAVSLVDRPTAVIEGASVSHWIALSRDPAMVRRIAAADRAWKPLPPRAGFAPWSDDYGSILPLLKF